MAKRYKNIYDFLDADLDSLLEIEEVGSVVAESILTYVKDEQNRLEIEKLLSLGVNVLSDSEEVLDGVFLGEKVVLTGTLTEFKRDQAIKIIEQNGGEIMSSVSKKTTLVIAGESAGSKLDKALKLGIKIIDEDTFKSLIKT